MSVIGRILGLRQGERIDVAVSPGGEVLSVGRGRGHANAGVTAAAEKGLQYNPALEAWQYISGAPLREAGCEVHVRTTK